MIELRAGTTVDVTWGDGSRKGGSRLQVELRCAASDGEQSVAELRGFSRWAEGALARLLDGQDLGAEPPDVHRVARRIAREVSDELRRFHVELVAVEIGEPPLWRVVYSPEL